MHSIIFAVAFTLEGCASAAPVSGSFVDIPADYAKGFKNPTVQSSAGGQAICISGMIDVTASANNLNLNYQPPANQSELTELVVEIVQINSTIGKRVVSGLKPVSGTYSISSQLCFPKVTGTINATTIQFLVNGLGFDHRYWNALPGYSYVDAAATQGYTTFLFDQIGTGLSDRPDAISIIQAPLQIEISHQLVQLLRAGGLSGQTFKHVVGVGHSFGSFQINGLTTKYPRDLDAAVLTGFSADYSGSITAFAGVEFTIASLAEPTRFSSFPNGFLTSNSIHGSQYFFFRAPQFDPEILNFADSIKQTISIGEFFTQGSEMVASNYTGPIDVVNGENDLPNCHGNCLVPINKAAAVKNILYPAASNGSDWYIAPGTGHGLNFHYTAAAAFEHIHGFIRKNGF